MLKKIILCMCLFTVTTTYAMLPPQKQTVAETQATIKLDKNLQELCNSIAQIWHEAGYTPADCTFLTLQSRRATEMPVETLLSAILDTITVLDALDIRVPHQLYKDIKPTLEAVADKLIANFGTKISPTHRERLSGKGHKAPTFSALNILNDLTVNGKTNIGKNLAVAGNISGGAKGQFCFNAATNCLGIGTKNPTCKLDVRGSSNIQDNLIIGGDLKMPHCADGVLHAHNGLMSGSSVVKKDLADNSVTTFALADLCVTNDKLSRDSVTSDKVKSPLELKGNLTFNDGLNAVGCAAEAGLRIIRGTIDADGTILSGSGFTVQVTGEGTYSITFDQVFSGQYSYMILANTLTDFSFIDNPEASAKNVSASNAVVQTYRNDPHETWPAAHRFGFIAIGS